MARCEFCGKVFEENCEYVDVGVGMVQCSPNVCVCGAYELGYWELTDDLEEKNGWVRPKERSVANGQG